MQKIENFTLKIARHFNVLLIFLVASAFSIALPMTEEFDFNDNTALFLLVQHVRSADVNLTQPCGNMSDLAGIIRLLSTQFDEPHLYKYLLSPLEKPEHGEIHCQNKIESIIELHDGNLAVAFENIIQVLNPQNGEWIVSFTGHTKKINAMITLKNGDIASVSESGSLKIWNPWSGKCTELFNLPDCHLSTLTQLHDESIVIAAQDQLVRIFQTAHPKDNQIFLGHRRSIEAITQLSEDIIASGSTDKTIKIWDLSTGQCIKTLRGHYGAITSLVCPTKESFASASNDHSIKLWNFGADTFSKMRVCHADAITSLTRLGSGEIASSSLDNTIKGWDPQDLAPRFELKHGGAVNTILQLRNGSLIATSRCSADLGEYIVLWNLYPQEVRALFAENTDESLLKIILLVQLDRLRKHNERCELHMEWAKIFATLPNAYKVQYAANIDAGWPTFFEKQSICRNLQALGVEGIVQPTALAQDNGLHNERKRKSRDNDPEWMLEERNHKKFLMMNS
jgi:WD40 repeat protein